VDGKKYNPSAKRQSRFRKTQQNAGKQQMTIWLDTHSKGQFIRIKELLQRNNEETFEAIMTRFSELSDEEILNRLKVY